MNDEQLQSVKGFQFSENAINAAMGGAVAALINASPRIHEILMESQRQQVEAMEEVCRASEEIQRLATWQECDATIVRMELIVDLDDTPAHDETVPNGVTRLQKRDRNKPSKRPRLQVRTVANNRKCRIDLKDWIRYGRA